MTLCKWLLEFDTNGSPELRQDSLLVSHGILDQMWIFLGSEKGCIVHETASVLQFRVHHFNYLKN